MAKGSRKGQNKEVSRQIERVKRGGDGLASSTYGRNNAGKHKNKNKDRERDICRRKIDPRDYEDE
jgi:hypothetical protein